MWRPAPRLPTYPGHHLRIVLAVLRRVDVQAADDYLGVWQQHGVGEASSVREVARMAFEVVAVGVKRHALGRRPPVRLETRRRADVRDARCPCRAGRFVASAPSGTRWNSRCTYSPGGSKSSGTKRAAATARAYRGSGCAPRRVRLRMGVFRPSPQVLLSRRSLAVAFPWSTGGAQTYLQRCFPGDGAALRGSLRSQTMRVKRSRSGPRSGRPARTRVTPSGLA